MQKGGIVMYAILWALEFCKQDGEKYDLLDRHYNNWGKIRTGEEITRSLHNTK